MLLMFSGINATSHLSHSAQPMVVRFLGTEKFDSLVKSAVCGGFGGFSDTNSCTIVMMGRRWSVNKQ